MGIALFCVGMTGTFVGNMIQTMMIGEINRKRQEGNLVSYFGFWLSKNLMIFREYRALYPRGRLHIYFLVAIAFQWIGVLVAAVCARVIG